jgi:hypothetical protein
VGVLLCRDSEASFLCVQHYTLHLISYYLALCLFSGWKLGERGGGEGASVTVYTIRLC